MAFVYWRDDEAVPGITKLEDKLRDRKYGLTLWALKCL